MNKPLVKNILILLLLATTIFCVFKYILALKERDELSNTLNQVKEEAATLKKEKQNLLQTLEKQKELQEKLVQQNSILKASLEASRIRLTKLFKDVFGKQRSIEELNSQFSIARAENKALMEKGDELKNELTLVSQVNEGMKTKLSSIAELKKAIRELKKQPRKVSPRQRKPKEKIIEGNRGFLVKDGKIVYPAKVRIEVIPASPAAGSVPKTE
jgi:predicted Ser/Thr protein kinase